MASHRWSLAVRIQKLTMRLTACPSRKSHKLHGAGTAIESLKTIESYYHIKKQSILDALIALVVLIQLVVWPFISTKCTSCPLISESTPSYGTERSSCMCIAGIACTDVYVCFCLSASSCITGSKTPSQVEIHSTLKSTVWKVSQRMI